MSAAVFAISDRARAHSNQIASVGDFTLAAAAESSRDAQSVFTDPACTLYCLDLVQQRAIFVTTPPSIDLHASPFLYQAQFQHAQRVIAVPFEEVLAANEDSSAAAPHVAFLYSVGRCGSTLLGRALHALPDVICLAEPDAPIHCIGAPDSKRASELLLACVRLLCKSGPHKRASHFVIKLRHVGIKLGRELQQQYPTSRGLFVYRNATEFVQSALRAFHPLPPSLHEYHQDPIRFTTRQWLSVMQHYLTVYRSGATLCALRYEDLLLNPQQTFAAICRHYGLAGVDHEKTAAIFGLDSQAGSNLARENLAHRSIRELGTPQQIEQQVRDTLASHPELNRPDFIAPGALPISAAH